MTYLRLPSLVAFLLAAAACSGANLPTIAGAPDGGTPVDGAKPFDGGVIDTGVNDVTSTDVVPPLPDGSVCFAGQQSCAGQTPETCVGGQWVFAMAPCSGADPICVNGACAECSPSATQCGSPSTVQECDATGQWQTVQTCGGSTPDCAGGACVCPNTVCGDACVDLMTDPNHCGSCTTPCAYTCSAGACGPLELVSNTGALGLGIAANGSSVYWLSGAAAATIEECAVSGCNGNPTQLTTGVSPAAEFGNMLVLSSQYLYFPNGTEVQDMLLSTATSGVFATTSAPQQVVVDAHNVYWADDATNVIYSCPLGASCTSPTILVNVSAVPDGGTVASPQQLAVDSTYIYWSDSLGNINSYPLLGGATALIASGASPFALVASAGNAYWTGASGVFRCPANAASAASVYYADPSTAFANLATDGATLYWTTGGSPGAVRKCALGLSCTSPTTLADGVDTPSYIAIDAMHSYWLQGSAIGTVYEFSK